MMPSLPPVIGFYSISVVNFDFLLMPECINERFFLAEFMVQLEVFMMISGLVKCIFIEENLLAGSWPMVIKDYCCLSAALRYV